MPVAMTVACAERGLAGGGLAHHASSQGGGRGEAEAGPGEGPQPPRRVCLSHLLNDSPSASWFGCLHPIFLCSLLGKVEESQELSSESDIFVQSEIY